jgi:hypothetical protein
MYFAIDSKRKVIFGWSAKAGCTSIKKYFLMLTGNDVFGVNVHKDFFYHTKLPQDVTGYTVIFFVRNPYKRVISAYLDRFRAWHGINYCFRNFLRIDPELLDYHHFCPQMSEQYDNDKPGGSHIRPTHVYDIEKVDYAHVNALFGVSGLGKDDIFQGTFVSSYDPSIHKFVGNDSVLKDVPTYQYFYDSEIEKEVEDMYKKDFDFFREHGIEYTRPTTLQQYELL